ncbi:P-loop NTPase fold protein [Exiguobacterium acetylicum]|uniref:P-loop NTPase fold protein n=1 Tax=Exiguobacterium acetylicum TaxID=41170 RepID=UPI0038767F06
MDKLDFFIFYSILITLIIFMSNFLFYVKKNNTNIDFKLTNLFSHVGLVLTLGFLFKSIGSSTINNLLLMYWSAKYFLLIILLLLLIKELIIFRNSFKKVISHFSNMYYYLGLTYIFSSIFALNTIQYISLILIFILVWLILKFISLESTESDNYTDESSDVEIKLYEQLMPTRKIELKKILEILINNNYNEPFALLVNGSWGQGKTSLINVLTKKLKIDGNYNIFIQPLMLDTSEKLMEYFFGQLENILKSNGIYTGKGSPFKKYINVVFQTINTLNLKQIIKLEGLLNEIDSNEDLDFRKIKEAFEKDIQKLLQNENGKNKYLLDEDLAELRDYQVISKKIFIIIDDFDRVELDTFKNTLIFIKELVNFKGINVIFLMDEQILLKNQFISEDYLDKFVNKKIHLSKIGYEEIFDHFSKNLKSVKQKNEFYELLIEKIKINLTKIISDIILDFEDEIKRVSLLKSEKNKKGRYSEENILDLEKKIDEKKSNLDTSFNELINGLSNSRKVKKIMREIQENLNIIISKNYSESINFKKNLTKIDNLEDVIVRISIYKIIFKDNLGVIYQLNQEFYNIIHGTEDSDLVNHILNPLFSKYFTKNFTENQGLVIDILNDLFNFYLFNYSLEKLLLDKKTVTQMNLEILDNPNNKLEINNYSEVEQLLRTIMFNSHNVNSETTFVRKKKLVNKIEELYNKNVLSFKNLFEILSKPNRNALLNDDLYLSTLKKIIVKMNNFESEEDEKISLYFMDEISRNIFLDYRNYIIELIRLQGLDTDSELKDTLQFKSMINILRKMYNKTPQGFEESSSIEFLNKWLSYSTKKIKDNRDNNIYIVATAKYYEENIRKFITINTSKEEIENKLRSMKIHSSSRLKNRYMYKSKNELMDDLNHMYNLPSSDILSEENLDNFSFLLRGIKECTSGGERLDDESINKLEKIYKRLPIDNYEKNSFTRDTVIFCTLILGEIIKISNHNID